MTQTLDSAVAPEDLRELAAEVRRYLRRRRSEGAFEPHCDGWADDWNPAFSQELAERGWAVRDPETFRLTREGLRFADAAAELFLK